MSFTKYIKEKSGIKDSTENAVLENSDLPRSIQDKVEDGSDVAGFLETTNGRIEDLVRFVEKQPNIKRVFVNRMFFIASIPSYLDSFKSEHLELLKKRKYNIGAGDGKNVTVEVRLK